MNENEFVHDGKTYIAVDDDKDLIERFIFGCDQCAISRLDICDIAPDCLGLSRADGRAVHFEEKQ